MPDVEQSVFFGLDIFPEFQNTMNKWSVAMGFKAWYE